MMGIAEIKSANEDPEAFAKSGLTDGQRRRVEAPPSNYWSEHEPNAPMDAIEHGESVFYKPVHGGYPEAENIAEMQLSRAQLIRSPLAKPPMYFEAIRMWNALDHIANEARARATGLKEAIRLVQTAGSEDEVRLRSANLSGQLSDLLNSDDGSQIKARLLIEDLVNTIDQIAPPDPKGYVPNMGLHHAIHPVRKIATALSSLFKREG